MHTLIVGAGQSGLAVARHLDRQNQVFTIFDDRKTNSELAQALGRHKVGLINRLEDVKLDNYDRLVVSPGIAMSHPLILAAADEGITILSELELAFHAQNGTVVAVTGSNGKSTTVTVIDHLLRAGGFDSVLCGNIGTPFIEVVNQDPNRVYVVEVSSFQLEHVQEFKPKVGVILNVAPDHLDRHGSFEVYRDTKLKLFQRQDQNDHAFAAPELYPLLPGQGSKHQVPGPDAYLSGDHCTIGDDYTVSLATCPLMGSHNRGNLLFALAACRAVGLKAEAAESALADVKALEHRMEPVGEHQGRLWVNDSKATNVHACRAGLDALDRPYVLVLGGSDKGESFDGLNLAENRPKAIVAYGETASKIAADLQQAVIQVANFDEACRTAHRLAAHGDVVLLSPACASFDQFANFMARGRRFKELFQELVAS